MSTWLNILSYDVDDNNILFVIADFGITKFLIWNVLKKAESSSLANRNKKSKNNRVSTVRRRITFADSCHNYIWSAANVQIVATTTAINVAMNFILMDFFHQTNFLWNNDLRLLNGALFYSRDAHKSTWVNSYGPAIKWVEIY